MYDDLVLVLACELCERILAIRSLLDDPAPRARAGALACVLREALDAVAAALGAEVVPALRRGEIGDEGEARRLAATIGRLAGATRAIHLRLGPLNLRWVHSAPDIVARKLREDGATLTPPAVCLSDEYDCLDHDVPALLWDELAGAGVRAAARQFGRGETGVAIILLPRCEAGNPLAWTLLLGPLARLAVRQGGLLERLRGEQGAGDDALRCACFVQIRLGGPAGYAAAAAHALFMADGARPAALPLPLLAAHAATTGGAFTLQPAQQSFFQGDMAAFYSRLLREQAALLGGRVPPAAQPADLGELVDHAVPRPRLPAGGEAGALFAKLDEGTPINAIGATIPPRFADDLRGCADAAGFYALLARVPESPSSLATILTLGWLYKAQRSYSLFRDLVRAARGAPGGAAAEVLASYGAHVAGRGLLLQQSIEAAYVHQIFARWGREGGEGEARRAT